MARKLRILATCQVGYPEPYPSLFPMEEMAKCGHYVHAFTGMPNYPMGKFMKGYEKNKTITEEHNGIQITHVPIIPRGQGAVMRALNYHSYPISAKRVLSGVNGNYDVVYANQSSPVMMVEPAIAYAKKWHKKVVMYCMDLWPASLKVGGVKENSPIYKFYTGISKRVYQNVDVILVTSKSFKKYLKVNFSIPDEKMIYLPQYAVADFDNIPEQPEKATTDFVFAGNVGIAQNLYVFLKAARLLQDQGVMDHGKQILFHIIGDGHELQNLKNYAENNHIQNVIFHGRKPQSDMPKYYAFADAMLVALTKDPLISYTLPAKVQGYMSAGKPILASADGEIANVMAESNAGFCSPADDYRAFAENVKKFIECSNREEFGFNAQIYYKKNFEREMLMDRLEKILIDYSGGGTA